MRLWRYALIELADEVVELHTREAAERAVLRGRLTADTPVVLYDEDGVATSARAGELDQFADLPGIGSEASPAPPTTAPTATSIAKFLPLAAPLISVPLAPSKAKRAAETQTTPPAVGKTATARPQSPPAPPPPPSPAPPPPPPPPPPVAKQTRAVPSQPARAIPPARAPAPVPAHPRQARSRQLSSCLPLLVIAVLALLLYAFVALRRAPGPTGTPAWVRREVAVLDRVGGTVVGSVPRGKPLRVSAVEGEPAWRVIADGPFAGRFIAADLVANTAPPALDTGAAGRWRLSRRAPILDAPAGRQLQNAPRGTRVRVVGRLQDRPEWLELALQNGDVGYVLSRAVRGVPAAKTTADAPRDEPGTGTDRTAEPRAAQACASLPSTSARARCRWPAVRRADRGLAHAYAAAAARGADPGSLESWRGELEACGGDQACMLARYRDRRRAVATMVAPVTTPAPASPPVRVASDPSAPRLRTQSWLSGDDYPPAALRAEKEGRTSFLASVDATGRVTACTVVASSGSADLDATTCRVLRSRARFDPARDEAGKPVPGTYSSSVRWQIPR